jgi:hypothetical protein
MSISSLEDFEVYFDYFFVTGIPPVNTGLAMVSPRRLFGKAVGMLPSDMSIHIPRRCPDRSGSSKPSAEWRDGRSMG